jgi:hypothetical protein
MRINMLEYSNVDINNELLIDIFNEGDPRVKWMVCDFIVRKKRYKKIGSWIINAYLNRTFTHDETSMLALCISKILKKNQAIDILKQGFLLHPVTTAEAFDKIIKPGDLPIIEELIERLHKAEHIPEEARKLGLRILGITEMQIITRM